MVTEPANATEKPATQSQLCLMVIDSDKQFIELIKKTLKKIPNCDAEYYSNAAEVTAANCHISPIVILLGLHPDDENYENHVHALKLNHPDVNIVLVLDKKFSKQFPQTLKEQISDYLLKPANSQSIISTLNRSLGVEKLYTGLQSNEQLHWDILESIEEGILVVDLLGSIVTYNTQFVRLWKLPPDLVATRDDELLLRKVTAQLVDPEAFLEKVQQLYQSTAVAQDIIHFKDGRIIGRHTRPLKKENNVVGRLWAFRDITEQQKTSEELEQYRFHLEELVKQRTLALEAANQELESFSYSVSHDLQAPLRAIIGFIHILLEDCSNILDSEHNNYLNRISAASQRMSCLVDDLLQLSRLNKHEMQREKIDLSLLSSDVINELRESKPINQVEFEIEDNLITQGDSTLIRQILSNLINNACKFSAIAEHPKVKIGQSLQNGKQTFFVSDNGIGLDMQYAQKIFGAFQRLHRQDEYEGTGIGLATVQRIVKRHGGQIWVESKPGEGACFWFTLAS